MTYTINKDGTKTLDTDVESFRTSGKSQQDAIDKKKRQDHEVWLQEWRKTDEYKKWMEKNRKIHPEESMICGYEESDDGHPDGFSYESKGYD